MKYKQGVHDAIAVIEDHAKQFDDLAKDTLQSKGMRENPADKILAKRYRDKAATIRSVLPDVKRLTIDKDDHVRQDNQDH